MKRLIILFVIPFFVLPTLLAAGKGIPFRTDKNGAVSQTGSLTYWVGDQQVDSISFREQERLAVEQLKKQVGLGQEIHISNPDDHRTISSYVVGYQYQTLIVEYMLMGKTTQMQVPILQKNVPLLQVKSGAVRIWPEFLPDETVGLSTDDFLPPASVARKSLLRSWLDRLF